MPCSQVVQLARVGVRVLVVDVVCVMLVLIARVVVHAVSTQFSSPIFCSWRCTLCTMSRDVRQYKANMVSVENEQDLTTVLNLCVSLTAQTTEVLYRVTFART